METCVVSCPPPTAASRLRRIWHQKLYCLSWMVCTRTEGNSFMRTTQLSQYNPGAWAASSGQDFVRNNAVPTIDFATVHAWPDNWNIG
eukprot:356114-Chlamydomonas_euryale.AAC.2